MAQPLPRRRRQQLQRQASMLDTASSPGSGINTQNLPLLDPTINVLAVVASAVERQDDLRFQESAHIRELMSLRADFEEQLRRQEAARIDAIRAVDVQAVTRAAEVSATQASTLAAQVATAAEAMRAQVGNAASAAATALANALEPIQKSIDDLRKAQYEQQGQKYAQSEGKDTSQWVVVLVIGIVFSVVQVALHFLPK